MRGRADHPFAFIGLEVAAEFRTEEQHVLLSKIHTYYSHGDTHTHSQCDCRMTSAAAAAAGQSALWAFRPTYNLLQFLLQFVNNGDWVVLFGNKQNPNLISSFFSVHLKYGVALHMYDDG